MNDKNLIPNEKRTPSERRENARKAGKVSGQVRREKKTIRETFEYLLSLPVTDENVNGKFDEKGVKEKYRTNKTQLMFNVMMKAMRGDMEAVKYVTEMIGEQPATALNISGRIESTVNAPTMPKAFESMTVEELREFRDGMKNAEGKEGAGTTEDNGK